MLKEPYKSYQKLHIYNIDIVKDIPDEIYDDNDFIGIWHEEATSLIFFHKNKDDLIHFLKREKKFNIIFYTEIDYFEWESGKYIKSFNIGEYKIIPIWEKPDLVMEKEKKIIIDPSVVFGSGFHPTTKMIMESLYNNKAKLLKQSKTFVDLGCGTGILSIFAKKIGIDNITAIDKNNLSYEVTKKNFEINDLKDDIYHDDIYNFLPYNYDIVCGNLYYHLLEDLMRKNEFWKGKFYFLSGFIKEMSKRIEALIPENYKIIEKKIKENWVMIFIAKIDI